MARRASVIFEFAFLAAIVIGVAVAGSSISRHFGTDQDAPLEIAVCFVLALIVYHAWFYFLRDYHTKNVAKYIDYLYLGVAAVGLLSAGLEFSRQQYATDVRAAYDRALDALQLLPSTMEDHAYMCRKENDQSERCSALQQIPTNFRFRLNEVKLKPSIDGVEGLERWARALQKEYHLIDNPEASFLAPAVVGIRSIVNGLRGTILSQDPQGLLARYRFFGFFLLAAALAIRITKVSIEIFEWYRAPTA
ncbi:hypothetical protein BjapCC829_19110 [Bradyrhizobium barranii]|uniref:DUF4239 domain-containing protein n=1 Tax=Bradyrhizobium barranii TaxID=2992140 RepID=A0ABY3QWW2_9BRAD|nr:hypothetical protein [Bradyrhizobium japonicum]UFW90524.1 hypothetical protein BjapCC829_19110 [Bradyrhizobium japonicum]